MTTTYSVHGMTCGGCANSVTRAIQAAKPGTEVSVDLDAKTVSVSGGIDEATVAKAVEDAGFEFKGAA